MLLSDLHIHTLASGHAFCTFNECLTAANEKGLSLIAITDHGPSMVGAPPLTYFEMSSRCPKSLGSMTVLFGCETNIISVEGDLDLPSEVLSNLDIVLAGLQGPSPYPGRSEAENTNALISLIKDNKFVNIITHPVSHRFLISVNEVVLASIENNILLELNVSLIIRCLKDTKKSINKKIIDETCKMVDLLQSKNKKYIVDSDAHHTSEIGVTNDNLSMLKSEVGMKECFILNNDFELLSSYISSTKKYNKN
jgi:putative hydrolase